MANIYQSVSTLSPRSPFPSYLQVPPLITSEKVKKSRTKSSINSTLCVICENEPSRVCYLGAFMCTGCRAFWRRSVKDQKTYQCLNNKFCGNGKDISNRLACKFHRFKRCVDSGLLDKKLQLHSDHADINRGNSETSFPLVKLDVFIADLCPILCEFTLLKRRINYERHNTYHGKETKISLCETKTALHSWSLGMYEFDLLNESGKRCDQLFAQIDGEDWEELLIADYSMMWCLFSQIVSTLRNNGQEEFKSYLVDQSYFYIKEETSGEYWSYIYHNIADENREQIFNIVRAYFLAVSTNLVTSVCKAFDRIKMDEAENSAFMMLLFTNPSSLSVLSDQTRTLLREWKNKTLAGIAQHIERTGRDVHERMGEIIFLLTEFQDLLMLARNAFKLLISSTNSRGIPKKFIDLIIKSNARRVNRT